MTTSPTWRAALASAASAAVLVAVPLVGAQTAHAQYPPPPPTLSLDKTTVTAGDQLTLTAHGFFRRERVTVSVESRPIVLGRFIADDTGSLTETLTIPTRVVAGTHTLELRGNHHHVVTASLQVLAAPGAPTPSPSPGGPGRPGRPGGPGDDDRPGRRGGDEGAGAAGRFNGTNGANSANGANGLGGRRRSQSRAGLAATGSEKALAVGGTAAALIAAGGGTMLAVRRRRTS